MHSVGAGGDLPQKPQISVTDNGQIKIGDRVFNVKLSGNLINDPLVVEKVKGLLIKSVTPETLHAHLPESAGTTSPGKVQIRITQEGVSVHKGETVTPIGTADAFTEKYEKIEKIIQSKAKFADKVAEGLEKYTAAEITAAAKNIVNEQGVDYLYYAEGKAPPEWGDKTLADILQLPGNEGVYAGLKQLAEKPSEGKTKKVKECENDLRLFLIQSITRNSKQSKSEGGTCSQTMGMGRANLTGLNSRTSTLIDDEKKVIPNRGFTSSEDRGKTQEAIKNHNTNLGAVIHAKNGVTQCIVTRSGKSDSLERLKEATLDALFNQLSTDKPKVIVREDGVIEFRHAITSFMDLSWEKAMGSPGNERDFLKKMMTALKEWPLDGYRVTIKDSEGKEHEVILKKPILREQLFSVTVKGNPIFDLGQTESDCMNIVSTGHCVNEYLKQNTIAPSNDLKKASLQMDEELQKLSGIKKSFRKEDGLIDFDKVDQLMLMENTSFLKSSAYKAYSKAVAEILLKEIKKDDITALALYSMMFRKTLPPAEEKVHPADLEIFSNIVYDNLNISSGKQCKSGKDRTAIGIALKTAQVTFQEQYGKPFIPDRMTDTELVQFKSHFRRALKDLCAETTLESQGYMGFKWDGGGGNPVPYKYLYNEQDIELLKKDPQIDPHYDREGRTAQIPDVVGLTQKEVESLGKGHLEGRLRDNTQVYGKSSKATIKELAKTVEQTKGQRQAAKNELNAFFGREVINDSLQLNVHISQLSLGNKENYNKLNEQIEKLSEGQSITNRMQLYALVSIKNLADERAAIKKMELPERKIKVPEKRRIGNDE